MTTADWTPDAIPLLHGRTIAVTGANDGIGWEATRVFLARGASVLMLCRAVDKAHAKLANIPTDQRQRATVYSLDLLDLDRVRDCSEAVLADHAAIDVLVNNAGIMGGDRLTSAQGYEGQMATNHLAAFALTAWLWPALAAAPAARVVATSSLAARWGALTTPVEAHELGDPVSYDPLRTYANSKQADLVGALEFDRRLRAAGSSVASLVVHPGVSATSLFVRQARDWKLGPLVPVFQGVGQLVTQSARMAALPTVRAATDPGVMSGQFLGPASMQQWRGLPVVVPAFSNCTDVELGRQLWAATQELVAESCDAVGSLP